MLDTTNSRLISVAAHRIGNKLRDEGCVLADGLLDFSEPEAESLRKYFFNHFKGRELYRFVHPVGLDQNSMFAIASRIFSGKAFIPESRKAARFLYEVSDHPRIKAGDLFVAHFEKVVFGDIEAEAIGVFKADRQDTFLKVYFEGEATKLDVQTGTNVKAFDKGALILRSNVDSGMRVLSVTADATESTFWAKRFLNIDLVASAQTRTLDVVNLCKQFSDSCHGNGDSVKKVDLLERTYHFLSNSKDFSAEKYLGILDQEEKRKFVTSKKDFERKMEKKLPEKFELSPEVVKKQKRYFGVTIRLDDNAQIQLAPKAFEQADVLFEKGYDDRRKKSFYKIFFDKEM